MGRQPYTSDGADKIVGEKIETICLSCCKNLDAGGANVCEPSDKPLAKACAPCGGSKTGCKLAHEHLEGEGLESLELLLRAVVERDYFGKESGERRDYILLNQMKVLNAVESADKEIKKQKSGGRGKGPATRSSHSVSAVSGSDPMSASIHQELVVLNNNFDSFAVSLLPLLRRYSLTCSRKLSSPSSVKSSPLPRATPIS